VHGQVHVCAVCVFYVCVCMSVCVWLLRLCVCVCMCVPARACVYLYVHVWLLRFIIDCEGGRERVCHEYGTHVCECVCVGLLRLCV